MFPTNQENSNCFEKLLISGLSTRSLFGSTSSPGFHGSSSFASVTPPPVGSRTGSGPSNDERTIVPPYPSPSPGASSQGSNKANWGNESKTSRVVSFQLIHAHANESIIALAKMFFFSRRLLI